MKARRAVLFLAALLLLSSRWTAAQAPGKVWHVGFLASRGRPASLDEDMYGQFPQGLRELGYVEGKNVVIEWRFADGKYERLPGLAAELVKLKVDVIVTEGPPGILAAQKATDSIPIVFPTAGDPVASHLVESLAHPGGHTTGISIDRTSVV